MYITDVKMIVNLFCGNIAVAYTIHINNTKCNKHTLNQVALQQHAHMIHSQISTANLLQNAKLTISFAITSFKLTSD